MVEGLSMISHQGKSILYTDYSSFSGLPRAEQKKKTLALLQKANETLEKYPIGSVLSIINVTGLYFDMEVVNSFKDSLNISGKYNKKMAIIGVAGIMKAAYNFVVGLAPNKAVRTFPSEREAKEWLASDY